MSDFYNKYYSYLEGATILKFNGMIDDDPYANGAFPQFTVKFKDGTTGNIDISQDPEGNGGGFIFGLALPS